MRRWSRLNTTGTKKSVATVARTRPPITATAERSVLLAAFAQSERHGEHADDHGKRRHEHRAQSADAGLPGRGQRVMALLEIVARKGHHQHGVCRRNPQAHDGPHQARERSRW